MDVSKRKLRVIESYRMSYLPTYSITNLSQETVWMMMRREIGMTEPWQCRFR